MSLNSVVNNLVRAAAGIPQDISDSDLDAHVAQLLAEEAKSKEKNWSELGLSGLLREGRDSPDPNAPKPNKRFLASVIRTVDGHNSALLRAQAAAARDVRVARGESSRSGGASRLFGGAMKSMSKEERPREKRRDRDRERDERVYRERDDRERESRRRYDTRDHMDQGHRSSRHELDEEEYFNRQSSNRREDDDDDRRSRRRRRRDEEDEEAYFNDSEKRSRREEDERFRRIRKEQEEREDHWTERLERDKEKERERKIRREEDQDEGRIRRESPIKVHRDGADDEESAVNGHAEPSRRKERAEEADGDRSKPKERRRRAHSPVDDGDADPPRASSSRKARTENPTSSPPAPLSKMDKYFNTGYDPRLDLGEVPKEGFVAEVGWDNMLAILKERGQKRRHQSPPLSDDGYAIPKNVSLRKTSPEVDMKKLEKAEKKKRKDERKKRRGDSEDSDGERAKRKATTTTGDDLGLFDIPYVKKGGVREWDVGK